jgi:hypothetical protein
MKKLIMLATLVGALLMSSLAYAVSIEPPLSVLPVAGEAEFNAFIFPGNPPGQAYVDWIVFNPGSYASTAFESLISGITGSNALSQYLYLYQIEARGIPPVSDIEDLTIYFDTSLATSAGSYATDLDAWHNSSYFANLAGEGEDAGASIIPVSFGPLWSPTNITWDFDGNLDTGNEGGIAWMLSEHMPSYIFAGISDTSLTGGYVPGPSTVPEPTSMLLIGLGLLGLAGKSIKRFKA